MPSYTLNGATIELQPQDREPFMWLASQVYRRMHAGNQPPPLPAILTMFAHEGTTAQGIAPTDPRIQAIMWTLWQLGLKGSRVEGEGESKQIKWDKGEHAGIDASPVMDCFSADAVRDGRTLAASLAIAGNRRINLNGTEIPVRINDLELIRAQSEEMNKRRQEENHDPSMAAARYVAELMTGGADINDLRLRAALELAADLGIRAMWVDTVSRQLRIAAFSREAALAAARAALATARVERGAAVVALREEIQARMSDHAGFICPVGEFEKNWSPYLTGAVHGDGFVHG